MAHVKPCEPHDKEGVLEIVLTVKPKSIDMVIPCQDTEYGVNGVNKL